MRRFPIRLFVGLGCGALLCVACSSFGALVVGGRAPNPQLNPLQALALNVTLWTHNQELQTAAGNDLTPIKFVIHKNDLPTDVGFNLVVQGLITDADLFRTYVRFHGMDSQLQAGTYLLNKTQTLPEIALALTNAGTNNTTISVIPGWRAEQVAEAINANKALGFSGSDFLAVIGPTAALPAWFVQSVSLPPNTSLEGFLYPDTYVLSLNATAVDFRDQMLKEFDQHFTSQMRAALAQTGLTLYQTVTLGSIVEREAVVADEQPWIAGVYLNRLRTPQTLDADPTIQYALGKHGNWWPQITVDDLHRGQSPYNTYLTMGLPPTPIAAPGQSALLASVYPHSSPYFYFRATCSGDGRHNFATTLAQQQANAC